MVATYDTALTTFCEVLHQHDRLALAESGCFVRDVSGKIRLLVQKTEAEHQALSRAVFDRLGPYAYDLLESLVALHNDAEQANVGMAIPEDVCLQDGSLVVVKVIDRRIGGQDWLKRPKEAEFPVPALVF